MYRGLIHFHSKYSHDSILSIKAIVDFAISENLNFLILTDHETLEGSKKLKEYVEKNNYAIEVLIAAEYNTEYGDIIALDIKKEIKDMRFQQFIFSVKEQNGYILFPHPYKGHKNINTIAKHVDLIEIFNSRVDEENNLKSEILAKKYSKNIYYASDAHNGRSLRNAIIEFKKEGTLIESMFNSEINLVVSDKTLLYEIHLSQIIKAIKQKRINLFIRIMLSSVKNLFLLNLFKKV